MAEAVEVKVGVPPLTRLQAAKVPADATFGQVREELAEEFGVPSSGRKVLFRGREMREDTPITEAGVKDGSKLSLAPTERSTGRKDSPVPSSSNSATSATKLDGKLEGIPLSELRSEIDRLERQLSAAEDAEPGSEDDALRRRLNEYLSRAMEALDSIPSSDEQTRQARKTEVARVQRLLDRVDRLRELNS
jgi:hypothetical protein